MFNEYFVNIGKNIASKFTCNIFLPRANTLNEEFRFKPVSTNETAKIISNLKNNKSSSGIINTKIIKFNKETLSHPIALLYNKCIALSTFSRLLKAAIENPLYKIDHNIVLDYS